MGRELKSLEEPSDSNAGLTLSEEGREARKVG